MTRSLDKRETIAEKIRFGGELVEFSVSFRRRKRLAITVHPDTQITVVSPLGLSREEVLEEVKHRTRWIVKHREFFRQFMPQLPEKNYVSGETFYYLGRQYRLKVVQSPKKSVKLIGKYIWVRTPDCSDTKKVKVLVQQWYTKHARSVFEQRLGICHKVAKRYKIPYPQIHLRCMTRRWGSCSKNTTILLNTELVKAPIHCVDYVIMHELCHFRFSKHDSRFTRLLSLLMPDWQERKARLEKVVV